MSDSREFCVLIHELGHALGAEHAETGVMSIHADCNSKTIFDENEDADFFNWLFEIYGLEIAQGVSDE